MHHQRRLESALLNGTVLAKAKPRAAEIMDENLRRIILTGGTDLSGAQLENAIMIYDRARSSEALGRVNPGGSEQGASGQKFAASALLIP